MFMSYSFIGNDLQLDPLEDDCHSHVMLITWIIQLHDPAA